MITQRLFENEMDIFFVVGIATTAPVAGFWHTDSVSERELHFYHFEAESHTLESRFTVYGVVVAWSMCALCVCDCIASSQPSHSSRTLIHRLSLHVDLNVVDNRLSTYMRLSRIVHSADHFALTVRR